MSKIDLIESEVAQLDDKSFSAFREWFLEYENVRWDRQLETDSASGKLDSLVEQALTDYRAGKSTPL